MSISLRPSILPVHIPPIALPTTAYANVNGTGDRRLLIYTTSSLTNYRDGIINGTYANELSWGGSGAGSTVLFDFGDKYIIDEVKWYQSDTNSHGSWKWQGSNDNSTWTDIGGAFTAGGATVQVQTSMNGNTIYYRYYRLFQISGAFNGFTSMQEIEFKISAPLVPLPATSWTSGDKRSIITVTKSAGFSIFGALDGILDGSYGQTWFSSSAITGQWIQFDFLTPKIVNRVIWYQTGVYTHGVWKWQVSNDASSWTDMDVQFTFPGTGQYNSILGGSNYGTVLQQLASNRTAYRYYRLLGISGSWNGNPNMIEIEFMKN